MGFASSCLPNERPCPAGCADVQSSVTNCGACGVACAAGQICQAGACIDPCAPGLGWCAGQCVSLLDDAGNCGACGNACAPGQACVNGACGICEQTVCMGPTGPQCVSLADSLSHCGACNNACPVGDICAGGACVLDCGTLTACDRTCVDLQSDDANCGGCGTACAAGQVCSAGVCACADELTLCGDGCIDTSMDANNCGACGHVCGDGYLCEAGSCVGPDGCTDVPVSGLSLDAIDAYQSVQIPVMEAGTAIDRGRRNADVVVGRETLFRVHVTPDAGWMPREVSARIELTDVEDPQPGQTQLYFGLLTPTGPSSDGDRDSTFNVSVPAEAIGADTRYALTLVECDSTAMAPVDPGTAAARFPTEGHEPLQARETGPLKVHIVPVGSPGPDTSEATLRVFGDRLEALYPVTEVIFTVGDPLQASATSMCSLLASVSSRRSQDSPAADVYYYGLTPGILGGQSGCSNASPSARGSKVSAGWAQGFTPDDGTTGAATMCHEIGHAHGRLHAPCNVSDPDPSYPYPNADIGVWGYDARTDALYEPTRKDMMSYCPEPRSDAWVSDYNYQAIVERVVEVSALAEVPARGVVAAAPKVPWRLLVSDSVGVHWIDEPLLVQGTPEGEAMTAVIHGDHGPMQEVEVYLQRLHDDSGREAFMLTLPEPDASWRAIEVPGLLAPQRF